MHNICITLKVIDYKINYDLILNNIKLALANFNLHYSDTIQFNITELSNNLNVRYGPRYLRALPLPEFTNIVYADPHMQYNTLELYILSMVHDNYCNNLVVLCKAVQELFNSSILKHCGFVSKTIMGNNITNIINVVEPINEKCYYDVTMESLTEFDTCDIKYNISNYGVKNEAYMRCLQNRLVRKLDNIDDIEEGTNIKRLMT